MAVFFAVFILPPFYYSILSHQSILRYFRSGGVDSRTQIRVPPGGYIMYQSHLLFLQYHHKVFICLLNMGDGLFPRSVIR